MTAISSLLDKFSSKTSLLVKSGILGLLVNSLTADDKNFTQAIQMQLWKKQKAFCQISFAVLKFR